MGRSVHTLNVGGQARGLVLHAATRPATPSTGHSLLLLLHGSTEDRNNGSVHYPAERFERNYHPVFAGHGFTLAYLSARLSKGWYCWENGNAEVGLCARSPDENDQHFTRAAVELVDREVGPVDRTRVHVLGMSGGASMAWRLGCESRSREITGLSPRVAAVAGTIAPSLRTCCCASPAMVAVHGDADTFVDVKAADAAAAWFAHAHGCTAADSAASSHAAPVPDVTLTSYRCSTERANTNTNTYTYANVNAYKGTDTDTYYNGTLNASTRLDYFRVAGGGHTLPGAPLVWRGLGPTSSFDGFGAIRQSWAAIDTQPGGGGGGGGDDDDDNDAPAAPAVALVLGALAAAALAVGVAACARAGWRRARRYKRDRVQREHRPSAPSPCELALGGGAAAAQRPAAATSTTTTGTACTCSTRVKLELEGAV